MALKITIFCSLFLFSSVICDIDTNYDNYIKKLFNLDELKTKIKAKLGDTEEAAWATIQMLDASTKFPSGILQGKFTDLGSFDECYNIKYEDIYGKYCLGVLPLPKNETFFKRNLTMLITRPKIMLHPEPRMLVPGTDDDVGLHFAFCVPHTMPTANISNIFKFSEDLCYSKATEPALSTGAIVTIVILSIFLCLVVLSTTYEIVLLKFKKQPKHELFIAFSFLSNGRKIFRSSNKPDQLLCLNGIKALSMMWVIVGHEYSLSMNGAVSNFLSLWDWQTHAGNMFIMGATVSVDTFFVVGGLVTMYTFLKSMDKGVKFNIILFYIHRYLRLTPIYFIVGLIHAFLLKYVYNGPLWKLLDTTLGESCRTAWWSNLLYITNYVQDGVCLPQAWYLSVDMQLFILSPIVLLTLYKWRKIGLGALGFLIAAGCIAPFTVGYVRKLGVYPLASNQGDPRDYQYYYYSQTYSRFGPYVIGLLMGYIIYKIKKPEFKIELKWWQAVCLWFVFVTGLVACVFAGFDLIQAKEYDRWANSLFLAFDRPAWAVAVSGVIFLCVTGYGEPVNTFLSLPVFQILTKLSYSMYLIHYGVITLRYAATRNSIDFSNVAVAHAFWGDFMFTLGLSLIFCLTFESPIIILEKYLFRIGPKRKDKTELK